jgi:hypothetical protein
MPSANKHLKTTKPYKQTMKSRQCATIDYFYGLAVALCVIYKAKWIFLL